MKKDLAIVIPFHKSELNETEEISLKIFNKIKFDDDIILLLPEDLNVNFSVKNAKTITIPPMHFDSHENYNLLLQSLFFYKLFENYKYIFIYQFDCLIFKNDLKQWIDQNYSFLGAPFFRPAEKNKFKNKGANGGASLRNVKDFINVLSSNKKIFFDKRIFKHLSSLKRLRKFIYCYLKSCLIFVFLNYKKKKFIEIFINHLKYQEDIFYSVFANSFYEKFSISPGEIAIKFSFEEYPRDAYIFNNHKLPTCCHGWNRNDKKFWIEILSSKFKIL